MRFHQNQDRNPGHSTAPAHAVLFTRQRRQCVRPKLTAYSLLSVVLTCIYALNMRTLVDVRIHAFNPHTHVDVCIHALKMRTRVEVSILL